jgi:hypothetical protein
MKQTSVLIISLLVTLLFGCQDSSLSSAEILDLKNLSLEWVAPVERENGELLTEAEIGGFQILYRDSGADTYKTLTVDTTQELITEYNFELAAGEYEFKIAAFDTEGLYSAYSDVATITIE